MQAKLEQIIKSVGSISGPGQLSGAASSKVHKNKDPTAKHLILKQAEADAKKKALMDRNGSMSGDCIVPNVTQSPSSVSAMPISVLA